MSIATSNLMLYFQQSASPFTLLTWSNKSSPSSILHVKNLRRTNRMLDKLLVSWILQRIFHASAGPLQLLTCASWLSAKLSTMMDMAFFTRLWYSFNTFGSALDGGAFSDPSTMSQRSTEAKAISILNFQRLNFSPWNLSITLTASLSRYAIFAQ